ncbi:MAG: hypothetical protein JEZ08_23610 [Clostridiales bacterium]|nr:hypothetical protein [Clostridiales bacterium]
MKNEFRITAKGYIILISSLFCLILIAGFIVRSLLPGNQLIFALNKELKKEEAAYNINLNFQTRGDAVLYKDKHLKVNSTLSLDSEKLFLEGYLTSNTVIVPSYKIYFTNKSLLVKTPLTNSYKIIDYDDFSTINTSKSLSLTQVFELLNLSDPELHDLMYINLFDIKNIFEDNIEIDNHQIAFSITLEECFKKLNEVLILLSQQEEFKNQIITRYSRLYDEFGQHPILKNYNLNSRILFNEMVALDNDFYGTLYSKLDFMKQKSSPFKGTSTLDILFTFKDQSINKLTITGLFNYKNFDANEILTLTIEPTEYQSTTLPSGEMSSFKPYVKKIYDTLKTEFK